MKEECFQQRTAGILRELIFAYKKCGGHVNLHESFYNVCTVIKGFKARVVLQVNRLYAMYMCCYNLIHVAKPKCFGSSLPF